MSAGAGALHHCTVETCASDEVPVTTQGVRRCSRDGMSRSVCRRRTSRYSREECEGSSSSVLKQIKLCTQKSLQRAKSRLANAAIHCPCHTATGAMPKQARASVLVLPLYREQHAFVLQKKRPLNSEAHEHEGGQGRGAPRRPCEKKHAIHSFPPSETHAAKQTKDERVLEPGAQRCHPRRFEEKRSV